MKITTECALFFILLTTQLYSMDKTNNDLFTYLPAPIRKSIILPLLEESSSLHEAQKMIICLQLVSKKSYEQTNCIVFTQDIITTLAHKENKPKALMSNVINTKGCRRYNELGNKLIRSIICYDKKEARFRLERLLNKGADINFQTTPFRTTPLMKAVELNKKRLVYFCLQNAAQIDTESRKGPTRQQSLLYQEWRIPGYNLPTLLDDLVNLMRLLTKKNLSQTIIYYHLYKHPSSCAIRDALLIDSMLKSMGGISHQDLFNDILQPMYTRLPDARTVITIITNPNNGTLSTSLLNKNMKY